MWLSPATDQASIGFETPKEMSYNIGGMLSTYKCSTDQGFVIRKFVVYFTICCINTVNRKHECFRNQMCKSGTSANV